MSFTQNFLGSPESIQRALLQFEYGKELVELTCLVLHGNADNNSTYFIVSDYYIVMSNDDVSNVHAIRTKDIETISLGVSFFTEIKIKKYQSQEEASWRVGISIDEKHKAALNVLIKRINQTIQSVRENLTIQPKAQNLAQHQDELFD